MVIENMREKNYSERLIGFDIRVIGKPVHSLWASEDRKKFLLRSDVSFPYSCDINAWPSVFDILDGLERPTAFAANAMFWDTFQNMQDFVGDRIPKAIGYETIAVTYCGDLSEEEMKEHYVYLLDPFPNDSTEQKWQFVGFDVADNGFESAVAGMGHVDLIDDSPAFRKDRLEYGKHLNKYHLFDLLNKAISFCDFENKRVPEHSPFFPFGIWVFAGL